MLFYHKRLSNFKNEIKYHNSNSSSSSNEKATFCLSDLSQFVLEDEETSFKQYAYVPQIDSHLLQFTLNGNINYISTFLFNI
jgi:hypothetical protein